MHSIGLIRFNCSCNVLIIRQKPPRSLGLAFDAGRAGGTAPAWFSAANEVVVDAFLAGRVRWVDIAALNAAALDAWDGLAADSVEAVLHADREARRHAESLLLNAEVPS